MNKTTDKELGVLHKKLAQTLAKQLDDADEATALLNEYKDDLPPRVITYLKERVDTSPAFLAVVSKFLKDNDITCQIEESDEASELAKRLNSKPKRASVALVSPTE